jgi:hypothetical protein
MFCAIFNFQTRSSTIYLCGDKNRSANFKETYKLIIKNLNKQYLCAFEKKYSVKS